jgi:hypothetical protein
MLKEDDCGGGGGGDGGGGGGSSDGDAAESLDDAPCFLDGPDGDCSDECDVDDKDDPCGGDDNPNRRRRRPRRRRDRGTVAFSSAPFDGFPTERDALERARELRLALHADRRSYCRRVFFLSVYSPAWQLVLRKNEVWVPSCARRDDKGGGRGGDGSGDGASVAAS